MSPSVDTNSIEILLVEDNPGDVRLTKEAFTEAAVDATFHTATDGDEALAFLAECADGSTPFPNLILLDLNLPRTDGFAVLEAIRADPDMPPLPVFVLTSSEAEEDVVRSYELSANAYLTKPSSPDEFVSLVRAVEEFWIDTVRLPPVPA